MIINQKYCILQNAIYTLINFKIDMKRKVKLFGEIATALGLILVLYNLMLSVDDWVFQAIVPYHPFLGLGINDRFLIGLFLASTGILIVRNYKQN